MDKDRIVEYLGLIDEVGVDYSAARRMGLTDDESDRIGMAVIAAAIDLIEELSNENSKLLKKIDKMDIDYIEMENMREALQIYNDFY